MTTKDTKGWETTTEEPCDKCVNNVVHQTDVSWCRCSCHNIKTPNRQDWRAEFRERFANQIDPAEYGGRWEIEDLEAFIEKILAKEKRKIVEEIITKMKRTYDLFEHVTCAEMMGVINSLSGKEVK